MTKKRKQGKGSKPDIGSRLILDHEIATRAFIETAMKLRTINLMVQAANCAINAKARANIYKLEELRIKVFIKEAMKVSRAYIVMKPCR